MQGLAWKWAKYDKWRRCGWKMGENAQGFLLRCTWGLCSMGSPLASCLPYQTIHSRLLCYTIPYHALPYTGMHMETVTYMGRFLALRQQHPPEDVLCPRLHPLWCSTSVSNQTLPYSLPYNVQWPYQTASSRNQPIPYRITQAKPCYTISDDNNDDNDGDDDDDDDDDVEFRLAQSVGLSCSVKSGLKIFVLFVFTFRDKLWQKRRKFGFLRQKCYNLGFLQGKCCF